jgi:hypothetical protein
MAACLLAGISLGFVLGGSTYVDGSDGLVQSCQRQWRETIFRAPAVVRDESDHSTNSTFHVSLRRL